MTNEKSEEDKTTVAVTVPNDLHDIYLMNRASMSEENSFHNLYIKILFSIDMGKEMLPTDENYKNYKDCQRLHDEAEAVLENVSNYPSAYKMELDTAKIKYTLESPKDNTGIITVKTEDVDKGIRGIQNQQAIKFIPKLRSIDSRIFKALIVAEIIVTKKPNVDDLIAKLIATKFDEILKKSLGGDGKSQGDTQVDITEAENLKKSQK